MTNRFAFAAVFAGFLGLVPSSGAETVVPVEKPLGRCTGKNLVDEAQRSDPAAYKAILDKTSATPNAEGLLWRIEKPGAPPSYLFGTMHVTDEGAIAIARSMAKYVNEAQTVATEVGEDPLGAANRALTRTKLAQAVAASRADTASLIDTIEDRDRVTRLLERIGVDPSKALRMPPWFVMSLVQAPVCEMLRLKAQLPFVDGVIESMGKSHGAKIVALEKPSDDFDLVASMDARLAVDSIVAVARKDDFTVNMFVTSVQLYTEQRIGEMGIASEILLTLPPDDAALNHARDVALLDKRNLVMRDSAEPLIDAGPVFIAVGAAHLVGEHGLVELFRSAGYSVTRVQIN